ncbi:ABC transporter transmembrane region [Thiothrix caldifontis]|uniref:ABC transporter transmembrane region n=1 Tax=Thiothrix caldifontis TaxID=525918 RepID=A0A1H4GTJ2_9GAMM|nr:ABC transporter six-transmembrane domain-containing protein [Thiothrix caldifontis]SEB12873.1 ABC transporter transmembrane region [Thiothrix caldifontis]
MSALKKTNVVTQLLAQYRGRLSLTYGLSITEQVLGLLLPLAIGNAINGLLGNDFLPLGLFIGLWLVLAALTVGRKMYDTRVFMSLYAELAVRVIEQQRTLGTSTSKLVARSTLIREAVDFLERDIPDIVAMLITFVGSLVMLMLFDWHIVAAAVLMLIPVLLLNGLLWKPINRLNRSINNNLERRATLIHQGSLLRLQQHFHLMRFLRVKTSDLEARTWGVIELFVVMATIYVFVYTAQTPGIEAGTIFSIVTYFWNFQGSLDRLPILMQSVSQVKDILRRIRETV